LLVLSEALAALALPALSAHFPLVTLIFRVSVFLNGNYRVQLRQGQP